MFRVLLAFAVALLIAAPPIQAKELKIGIISMQRALNETDEGKAVLTKLQKKLSAETEELKRRQAELKKLEEEISKQGFMYSETQRLEKEESFRKQRRELERYRDDKRGEFMRQQQASTKKILSGLTKLLDDFSKKEGYDLILESSPPSPDTPGVVVYRSKAIDITNRIIELYNKQTKK